MPSWPRDRVVDRGARASRVARVARSSSNHTPASASAPQRARERGDEVEPVAALCAARLAPRRLPPARVVDLEARAGVVDLQREHDLVARAVAYRVRHQLGHEQARDVELRVAQLRPRPLRPTRRASAAALGSRGSVRRRTGAPAAHPRRGVVVGQAVDHLRRLEHPPHALGPARDAEAPALPLGVLAGGQHEPDAGRVHERQPVEVEHRRPRLVAQLGEPRLHLADGAEVQLAAQRDHRRVACAALGHLEQLAGREALRLAHSRRALRRRWPHERTPIGRRGREGAPRPFGEGNRRAGVKAIPGSWGIDHPRVASFSDRRHARFAPGQTGNWMSLGASAPGFCGASAPALSVELARPRSVNVPCRICADARGEAERSGR